MQQRQPRLGDILDDYCPRERRLTNHVVVAMIGDTVKQTRCTTCESDHEYKHATIPRQRRKPEQAALYTQVLAAATPKKVVPPSVPPPVGDIDDAPGPVAAFEVESIAPPAPRGADAFDALFELPDDEGANGNTGETVEEGPAHRRLIRAQLPRHEGQVSTSRQAPDFTIRQPNPGRPKRFGGRNPRAPQFQASRQGNGNGNARGGGQMRGGQGQGGRPQGGSRPGHRNGGRNRPK